MNYLNREYYNLIEIYFDFRTSQPMKRDLPSSVKKPEASYYQPVREQIHLDEESIHSLPQSINLEVSNSSPSQKLELNYEPQGDEDMHADYYCMTCHQNYNIKISPCQHRKSEKQRYRCEYEDCNRSFQVESTFQRHRLIHEGVKPYECDYVNCDQRFNQKSNLNRHKRIHTQDKPFICEKCCKSFTTTTNLKQHVQVHLEDKERRKKFVCQIKGCNKEYLYMCNLKKHKQEHDDPVGECLVEKKPDFPVFSFQIGNCSFRLANKRNREHSETIITPNPQDGIPYTLDPFKKILQDIEKDHKEDEPCSNCLEELDTSLRKLMEEAKNSGNISFLMHEELSPIANIMVKTLSGIVEESTLKVFTLIIPNYGIFMDVTHNLLMEMHPRE